MNVAPDRPQPAERRSAQHGGTPMSMAQPLAQARTPVRSTEHNT